MTISKNTKLSELMNAFPWLMDEAVKLDPKFKVLNNPIGKAFIKNSTIEDLAGKAGLLLSIFNKFMTAQILMLSMQENLQSRPK